MGKYPHLFEPIRIANHIYKNRILCAPMIFSFMALLSNEMAERMYRIIENRAKGGVAAVIVGETPVNSSDAPDILFPGTEMDYIKRKGKGFDVYRRYAELIKKHNAFALIEIFHAGNAKSPLPFGKGVNPWGPMEFLREDGVTIEAFDTAKMKKVREDFVTCSQFMKDAGFDGICIHGGHGFLFTQFLSPFSNRRTDEYGGNLENRSRFPREIMTDIRNKLGKDFIIELRINGADLIPGGSKNEEIAAFCSTLEGMVDLIHVSGGFKSKGYTTHQFTSMYDPHGIHLERAANIKKSTKIPVTLVGGINSPEFAESIIAEGKVDFVSLGRQMIADTEFANKANNEQDNNIRRCIRCYHCYPGAPEIPGDKGMGQVMNLKPATLRERRFTCTINPMAGNEVEIEKMPRPLTARKVLIVGGGPAGLQAAITACDRGHIVTLLEKKHFLGGLLFFTDTDTHKVDLKNFKDLLINQVKQRNIEILLTTKCTPDYLAKLEFDAIILAIGATPYMPPIPGIDKAIHVLNVYKNNHGIGNKVIMVGGGLAGCESALHLADSGHQIIIIERMDRLASEATGMALTAIIHQIKKRENIKVRTSTKCIEIYHCGVRVKNNFGETEVIEGEDVVYSLGMKAKRKEATSLKAAAGKAMVFEVGDCLRAAKVYEAISGGFMAAMNIK